MAETKRCPYCGQDVDTMPYREHPKYQQGLPSDDGDEIVFALHDRYDYAEPTSCLGGTAVRAR